MNNLQDQISRLGIPGIDTDYHYERLVSFPENEWFLPGNIADQDFQICLLLHSCNLIEKRNEPVWSSNSFRGHKIFFRYKLDMNCGNTKP